MTASGDPLQALTLVKEALRALIIHELGQSYACLLYTSDAADERSSVDLGGRRIIKKKTQQICDTG